MNDVLILDNISMEYRKGIYALKDIRYEFTNGIYGLLGPNGAGKSTMMNIITGNLKSTSGNVKYGTLNVGDKAYRGILGYVPQSQDLYPTFTLERFLDYMASLKNISKKEATLQIESLISFVNLEDSQNKNLASFSGGMKKRALIAQALLGNPKILVLDEPTAGLDPKERIRIRNLISKIAFDKIVIIATHVVTDIEFIAKEIVLMNRGVIAKSASPDLLCNDMDGKIYEITVSESEYENVVNKYPVCSISKHNSDITMRVISEKKPDLPNVYAVRPDLEDVYLYHFGEDDV